MALSDHKMHGRGKNRLLTDPYVTVHTEINQAIFFSQKEITKNHNTLLFF